MAPKTVQELYNLKPEELNALTVLSGLEGYRGGGGEDVAAVAANVLARRLSGKWGGIDIRNIAKSPGQYEAVFPYSMQQLADPAFGASKLGGEAEYNRIREIVNNPNLVGEQFRRSKGAQSFRGVAAYGNKKPTDYVPIPGKSNYYFGGLDEPTYKKGLNIFGGAGSPQSGEQAQGSGQGQEMSSTSFFQGLLSGMEGSKPKDLSVGELLQQELVGQLLKPVQPVALDPFQMLLNMSPYG